MRKLSLLLLVCGAGIFFFGICLLIPTAMAPDLASASPSGKYIIRGLAFKGSLPSKLDGTLRLYVYKRAGHDEEAERRIQTDIPYSRKLKVAWTVDRGNDAFSIVSRNGEVLATCRVGDDFLEWTAGAEHVVPDPYEARYESGE